MLCKKMLRFCWDTQYFYDLEINTWFVVDNPISQDSFVDYDPS